MTRYAFIAAVAALAFAGVALPAQAQSQTEAQIIKQQSLRAAQQAQAPSPDGKQLMSELRSCEELQPQSVRDRCAMTARKTGGQGIALKLAPESANDIIDQDQFDRFRQ